MSFSPCLTVICSHSKGPETVIYGVGKYMKSSIETLDAQSIVKTDLVDLKDQIHKLKKHSNGFYCLAFDEVFLLFILYTCFKSNKK